MSRSEERVELSEQLPSERVIICVDMDYFYAQIEERDHPDLKNRPLLVCVYSGRTETSGVVSTANYRARELGVRSGMPIFQAMRILKNEKTAKFLRVRIDYYREVSDRIMLILKENSDVLERVSIDEAYLEVGNKVHDSFEEARTLAITLKEKIMEQERLTCSIGIGPNKLVAKMAADFEKPNGLTVIPSEKVLDFISPMPIRKLFRVGKKAEAKFLEEGIKTVSELRSLKEEKLVKMFGSSVGKYYWNAARGMDLEPVESREEQQQISRIATLKQDTLNVLEVEPKLKEMAQDISSDLKNQQLLCKTISAIVILQNLQTKTKSKTVEEPTDSDGIIFHVAADLMRELLGQQKLQARRMGLKVEHFEKKEEQQDLSKFL